MEDTQELQLNNALVKLEEARAFLLAYHAPSYTVALKDAQFILDNTVQTIAFDGTNILYNHVFVSGVNAETLQFMLFHDNLHLIAGHPFRMHSTSKNPKVRAKYHTRLDNEVNTLISALGNFDSSIKLVDDKPATGGEHTHWPTLDKVFNEMNGKCEPWLRIKIRFETDVAKVVDMVHTSVGGYAPYWYSSGNVISQTATRAFLALDDNGRWIRVSKHNPHIRELVEIFQVAGKLTGEYEKL